MPLKGTNWKRLPKERGKDDTVSGLQLETCWEGNQAVLLWLTSAAGAEKWTHFIQLGFLDHKYDDLEGHPHSVTTIHKPLANTDIGTATNVYIRWGCSLTAWQGVQHGTVSAILVFCASVSVIASPNAKGEENWKSGQAPKFCVRDTISGNRWCGYHTAPCNRWGDGFCAIRRKVPQMKRLRFLLGLLCMGSH